MPTDEFDVNQITVREYSPELAEDLLAVRNTIFPPLTLQQWLESTSTFTASLAYLGKEPVGAIPFDLRTLILAPGRTARVAQENAVGVREEYRSRGIGTKMISAAAEFLADRCELLTVYRGAERSKGYNFYARTGHIDLLYLRRAECRDAGNAAPDVLVGGVDEIAADAEEIRRLFKACYSEMGGYPVRDADYWPQQLKSHIYVVLPHEFIYLRYPAKGEMRSYAILGRRLTGQEEAQTRLGIYELAAEDENAAAVIISHAAHIASSRGLVLWTYLGWEHPFRNLMLKLGFEEGLRFFMLMGRVISPQRLLTRAAADLEPLEELRIDVWTPTIDYTLWEGSRANRKITLEGKDWVITRLLTRRLDVQAAVATDLLTIQNGTDNDVLALARALPYCRWVYHHTDYI